MGATVFNELAAAEVFLHVVRAQSYTGAARALGRSASTLSRTVTELERHLDAQLLVRTTRRLRLTEAGSLYVQHAEALSAASRAGRDAITELVGGAPRGRLRVSMPVSVGERMLAPHLPEFYRRYPELRLELDLSDREAPLVQGGFDLVVRVGLAADSAQRIHLLGRVRRVLVASPAYLAKHPAPRHPRDLAEHPCIGIGPLTGAVAWPFYRRQRRENTAVTPVVQTTSPTLAAALAVSGLGLLRTIEWTIREDLERGTLVPAMREWSCDHPKHGGIPVSVLYAQTAGTMPPLKSRVFVDFLKELVAAEIGSSRSRSRA